MMISKAVDEIARNFDLDFEALLKGFTVESAWFV